MAFYFCKLLAPRPSFPGDMTPAEAVAMQAHVAHWSRFAEAGKALAFGPVLDPAGPWGLGLLSVADEAEARAFADGDPVVTAGLGFRYEIHPMPQLVLGRAAAPEPTPA